MEGYPLNLEPKKQRAKTIKYKVKDVFDKNTYPTKKAQKIISTVKKLV